MVTSMARETIGVIGLGLLGTAISERLLQGGFDVVGFDLDASRLRLRAGRGGRPFPCASEAALACRRLIFSLPDTESVESVVRELPPKLPAGFTIVDTTTGDPDRTASLGAELSQRGIHYLDATVSGSSGTLREGGAVMMVGGERQSADACADVLSCLAREWHYLGPWGSGARAKLVVNLVLGLNRAALAEGLAFARTAGLDLDVT